jgi:ubiquinone/menaquinone biosynthesis C-methylase UbiE
MELDEVTRWLDAVPLAGVIVELAAGSGWWSTLLAEKGELWIYDADGDALDAARQRLMAHGLLAHIHQQAPSAAADKQVDAVVASYVLGAARTEQQLAERVAAVRGWLKPGAAFVFIEAQTAATESIEGPAGPLWPRDLASLQRALEQGGLEVADVRQTQRAFVMGRAQAPAA